MAGYACLAGWFISSQLLPSCALADPHSRHRGPWRTSAPLGSALRTNGDNSDGVCSYRFLDRPNFGKSLDRVLVVPANGSLPCGGRLRGNVIRAPLETGGIVGEC